MKQALFSLIALSLTGTAVASAIDADQSYTAQAWFQDGTGLEIYTEATGSTRPVSTSGGIGIYEDKVQREVMDRDGYVLFAYTVRAWRTAASDGVAIRIEPIGSKYEAELMRTKDFKVSGPHIATVAAVREFPAVKPGEAVTLDILYNAASGEKVYDVLRPNTGPSPYPQQMVTTMRPLHGALQFRDLAISWNGKPVRAPGGQMSGPVALIYLPGHASYFLALEPSPKYPFQQVGHVERGKLNFTVGGDTVEVVSKTNLLHEDSATIWVYRDPYTPITTRQRKMTELDNLVHVADLDEANLRSMSETHGPNHPDLARARNKIADDKRHIADLRAELAQMKWDDAYVQTSSDVDSLMANR